MHIASSTCPSWTATPASRPWRMIKGPTSVVAASTNTRPATESLSELFGRWQAVADDPEPFLSLGLRDAAWLGRNLDDCNKGCIGN